MTGRPSKYQPEFCATVQKLSKLGAIDREIADFLEIDVATLHRWKLKHPDFCDSIKDGKAYADERVKRSLYGRALGYTDPDEKHYPPDVTACIFWLKNRMPDEFREQRQPETDPSGVEDALKALADRLPG